MFLSKSPKTISQHPRTEGLTSLFAEKRPERALDEPGHVQKAPNGVASARRGGTCWPVRYTAGVLTWICNLSKHMGDSKNQAPNVDSKNNRMPHIRAQN